MQMAVELLGESLEKALNIATEIYKMILALGLQFRYSAVYDLISIISRNASTRNKN